MNHMNDSSPLSMKFPKILVVEDDENVRELCRALLEKVNFDVETCANVQEALAFLHSHKDRCLIWLDMTMSTMDGREFIAAFAKRPHTIVSTAESRNGNDLSPETCIF